MVRLKRSRSIKWAGVEFQPDLQNASRPVKLGVVLVESTDDSLNAIVIGRAPRLKSKPQEFKNVGDITMNLAANWVEYMFKDVADASDEKIFDRLAERWKWNLYLVKPKILRSADVQGALEKMGERLYEKFVGQPFKDGRSKPTRKPANIPHIAPPAWQLEEFKRRKLGPAVEA